MKKITVKTREDKLMIKKKYLRATFILIFILCLFSINAFADKGVFNAKVTPDETFINTPTTITVTAEVGAENLYISSVAAYEVDATGKPKAYLCRMYDDGTHGDETEADTVFTCQFNVNRPTESKIYAAVTAAYSRDRNRYLSPNIEINIYEPIPNETIDSAINELQYLEDSFNAYLSSYDIDTARQMTLQDALSNPSNTAAELCGENLCTIYENKIRGIAFLNDPNNPTDQGSINISALPDNIKNPGNNKLLIYGPGYSDGQDKIVDHAQTSFNNAAHMTFDPDPPVIMKDANASLDLVKNWGDYGTVIMHTHGGYWSVGGVNYVVLLTGTTATDSNRATYAADLSANRLGVSSSGKYAIYPSYITKHANSMKNTFFYLGACESMRDDSMWNALKDKGAKVAFGWSQTVYRSFNEAKFKELIDPMLPTDQNVEPKTAKQAYDAISDKDDSHATPAVLTMKVASAEWDNFVFQEGGLINGNFETGDWTGWTHGGDYDYRIIAGARKHGGNYSAALGRWDTAYHGYDPTSEPFGYEWFYQDFTVPNNVTYLKFNWWMETYDTAIWDWFDAYIKDTNGNTLQTILYHAGKPGYNYGPYWTTQMAYGGDGWQEAVVDISAYRGQKIRIYFDQRLDGFGDQQRTYIDDVRLE